MNTADKNAPTPLQVAEVLPDYGDLFLAHFEAERYFAERKRRRFYIVGDGGGDRLPFLMEPDGTRRGFFGFTLCRRGPRGMVDTVRVYLKSDPPHSDKCLAELWEMATANVFAIADRALALANREPVR